MESFEDSNCLSMSDSFSLYERYMRSFNVVSNFSEGNEVPTTTEPASVSSSYDSSRGSNVDLTVAINNSNKIGVSAETVECSIRETEILCDKKSNIDLSTPPPVLFESSSTTVEHSLTEKSDAAEAPISSEDSKGDCPKQPVFITPTMENSNNAVDSVPLFHNVRPTDNVFKLPISELSFNGTIKHVQKLQPIVDPITALSSAGTGLLVLDKNCVESSNTENSNIASDRESDVCISNEKSTLDSSEGNKSSGDSQYEDLNQKKKDVNCKWKLDHSSSSYEASIDSGVRSPDMFSEDDDEEQVAEPNTFWNFLKDYEAHDKRKVKKLEEKLAALSPFRSKKTFSIDASEMLRKYYTFLPAFTKETETTRETNARSPIKRSPEQESLNAGEADPAKGSVLSNKSLFKDDTIKLNKRNSKNSDSKYLEVEQSKNDSLNDTSIILEMGCEDDAKESWPDVLKCKYHDVYYNVTKYSEKLESLSLRYGEKYVRAETSSSFNVNTGGLPSPNTVKRQKAQQKLAQPTSLGSRLSHIATRRMAFSREKPLTLKSNMILVEKAKPKSTAERRSPRLRRTPSKRTPVRDGSAKRKVKTPKSRSSSTKKAGRASTAAVPQARESFKRALFVSPEGKKTATSSASVSTVAQSFRASIRCSVDSPDAAAETQSLDGALRDIFLKRKRSALDDEPDNRRSKVAKSLSFGGDAIDRSQQCGLSRRASELPATKTTGLNERHKQKLLWAVSEALRVHGWRMTSPGFRDKAAALARLTRRLLSLPPHAARLADPRLNTSDTILKLARQYVFAIIQGRSIDDCFQEEQMKISNEANSKVVGYISAAAYRELKERQANSTLASRIKENACNDTKKCTTEPPRNAPKNVLQDKLLNVDSNSSSIGLSGLDKVEIYKSNSMPSFEEAAKMRARRQISFDNVEFPKR